ncbi:hypothetical protein HZ994_03055 [Akkermansiaceae bacterium]|nr:hypothetical protein HZ994_03055 [Akkermansiaceae bacterium]
MKALFTAFMAICLGSCQKGGEDSVWWGNEKTIIELRNQLELASYRADKAHPGDDAEAAARASVNPAALRGEIETLAHGKAQLTREIAAMKSGWDDFRRSVLNDSRVQASGKTFATFVAADGRAFKEAKVTEIDDSGVSIAHASGTARLRFGDLDPEWQLYFGLDAELARKSHEAEAEGRLAYDRRIDRQMAVIAEKEAGARKERKKEEQRLAEARAIASYARTTPASSLSASIGGLGETSRVYGSRRYGGYSSYYRQPTVRYSYVPYCGSHRQGIPIFGSSAPGNYSGWGCAQAVPVRPPIQQAIQWKPAQ